MSADSLPLHTTTHATVPTVEALREHPAAGRLAFLASAVEPLLLTADQAAALCGVSPATWYRMASAGRCPAPLRLSRGCVRWRIEDLREWISGGCVPRREFEARKNASGRAR